MFFRSVRENDWYPHYIHNLDNLIRFGGLFPPIHEQAAKELVEEKWQKVTTANSPSRPRCRRPRGGSANREERSEASAGLRFRS